MTRIAARIAAALGFAATLALAPVLVSSQTPMPVPEIWDGTFVPSRIFNELIGPTLNSNSLTPRMGVLGSDSCNDGYSSGSPGANPLLVT